RHRDTHFADVEMSEAMNDCHITDSPAGTRLLFYLGELLFCHGPVGLVVQRRRDPAIGQFPDRAQKRSHRAAVVSPHTLGERRMVNYFRGQSDHDLWSTLSHFTVAAADGRNQCNYTLFG